MKPALKIGIKDFDTSNHGGAPLLGLNGLVVKTHGSSTVNRNMQLDYSMCDI